MFFSNCEGWTYQKLIDKNGDDENACELKNEVTNYYKWFD